MRRIQVIEEHFDLGGGAMIDLETSIEKKGHQKEVVRVQKELGQFLSKEEARETAMQTYDLVLDVDEEIDRILQDQSVTRLYEYDGLFFTPRGTQSFHRAFNGIHILESLSNSRIETFFRGREKHFALKWFLEELGTHLWEVKVRRMNWEEFRSLGILPPAVISEIIRDVQSRRRAKEPPPPLSPQEQAFFQFYEKQFYEKELLQAVLSDKC